MSTTTGGHSLNLMACVRESSPPQDSGVEADSARHETKRRRFHPFRGLRRIFRRKVRHSDTVTPTPDIAVPASDVGTPVTLDPHRSRSTSQLLAGDQPTRRRSGSGLYGPHGAGLSVSHDSVFSAEQRSEHSSSEDLAQSSSSLSIQQLVLPGVKAELFDAVRRRRGDTDEDDEDLGLPRSPCISPTTVDVLLERHNHKDHPSKSHSTCSDGSLLSMGSSEMDDDSMGEHSGHSSKHSLHDKKLFHYESEFDLGVSASPLSHSAARHKMSVKPKRTHGAPRRRRPPQLSVVSELPTTPELNEDSARSFSPEASSISGLTSDLTASTEPLDWLPNDCPTETQLKSSSLPPGLALTSEVQALLPRSRSSAAKETAPLYKRHLSSSALETKEPKAPNQIGEEVLRRELLEEDEEDIEDKKKEESFFGRLLSRRSGKKKKDKSEDEEVKPVVVEVPKKRIDVKGGYANERPYEGRKIPLRPRQRVEPIDLPAEKDPEDELGSSPTRQKILGTSPTRPETLGSLHTKPDVLATSPAKKEALYTSPMRREVMGTSPPRREVMSTSPPRREVMGTSPPRRDIMDSSIPRREALSSSPPSREVLGTSPPRKESLPKHDVFNSSPAKKEILGTSPTKPEALNRMHVAYSASPPKPTWPESSAYFKPDPETKIVDFVAKSKLEEPLFRPKLRAGCVSTYQQKVINTNENQDERDYSSLIHTSTNGQGFDRVDVVLKKSKSFRENDTSLIENNFSKDSLEYSNNSSLITSKTSVNNKSIPDVNIPVEDSCNDVPDNDEIVVAPAQKTDDHKNLFMKNVTVTTRSVARERVNPDAVRKSASLESIGQAEIHTSPSERSSSTESISRSTSVADSAGISITQTTAKDESELPRPAEQPQPTMPITVSITSKPAIEKPAIEKPVLEKPVLEKPVLEKPTEIELPPREPSSPTKREVVRNGNHVPEFLRVQLNRVDSKPAINIVLSTSAIFEAESTPADKLVAATNQADKPVVASSPVEKPIVASSPLDKPLDAFGPSDKTISSPVNKPVVVSSTVGKPIVTSTSIDKTSGPSSPTEKISPVSPEKQPVVEIIERKMPDEAPKVSVLGMRIKKPSVDELDVFESPRVEKLDNFTLRTQELMQKPFDGRMEPVPKPRSISLLHPGVKKTPTPLTPARPSLRKQSSSLDSDEGHRRTFSTDFDNIQIVEKDSINNSKPVEEVSEPKSLIRKKSWRNDDSIVIVEKTAAPVEKTTSGDESPEVVLRKKSRDLGSQRKDDEPELLKVFARRSLKIKDSDTESFTQLLTAKTRDSDKENEDDSPKEERKKLITKEVLIESKPRSEEPSLKISALPPAPKQAYKYQRSLSMIVSPAIVDNNATKENDSVPTLVHRKTEMNFPHRWANIQRDKDIDLTNADLPKPAVVEAKPDVDENVPRFKRIQQRREEWELRAQQAATKKTIP